MKSIHTFDVFAPTDEQEEAMNKKRGGHYRRGKNKEMDYFIECATSLFPNNHYSRFTPIYDTTKEFYQLITSSDTTERAILNWIASNRAWNYLFGLLRHYYRTGQDVYKRQGFPSLPITGFCVCGSIFCISCLIL